MNEKNVLSYKELFGDSLSNQFVIFDNYHHLSMIELNFIRNKALYLTVIFPYFHILYTIPFIFVSYTYHICIQL